MHEAATQYKVFQNDEIKKIAKGSVNLLIRIFPLLFEDNNREGKELLLRSMWREQPFFNNQINALKMMESVSLLVFKPGYTVQDVPEGLEL